MKANLVNRVEALEAKMGILEVPPIYLFCGTKERDVDDVEEHSKDDEAFRSRFVAEGGIIHELNMFKPSLIRTREHPEGVAIKRPDYLNEEENAERYREKLVGRGYSEAQIEERLALSRKLKEKPERGEIP